MFKVEFQDFKFIIGLYYIRRYSQNVMEENEFIPVDHSKKASSSKKKKGGKSSSKSKSVKKDSISNKINRKKIETVVGSFLILFSFF